MIGIKKSLSGKDRLWSWQFAILLMSFYVVYMFLRMDPKLIYQSQEPVFFFDRLFFSDFVRYPGGWNELVARFLSQFFYYTWTGALLLVIIFADIARNTRRFIEAVGVRQPVLYMHWLPATLLLALHSDYRFPLVFTLGIWWTLLGINLYVRRAPANKSWRFAFYVVLFSLLYYIAAAQAFIFAITVSLYQVLQHRQIVLPSLYILYAALLPYVGVSILFLISMQDAYRAHLSSFETYTVTWLSWVLYAFFPLVLLLMRLESRGAGITAKKTKELFSKLYYRRSVRMRTLQGLLFFLFVFYVSLQASKNNQSRKELLSIDYYARMDEWESVIEMAKKNLLSTDIALYQANRALYHCGRLSDDLFSLPQYAGSKGLFLQRNMYFHFPLQHSDLFFDLGLLNESEHWAYEALAAKGYTAWNLQRLAMVNILENNADVAERYLYMLQKTMWHRAWAMDHRQYLVDNSALLSSPRYHYLKDAVPTSDFLVSPIEPVLCLEELLRSSRNKMAFEYFMSYCLLDGEISPFMKHLYLLNNFGYTEMPRHFEEAILIYLQMVGRESSLPGVNVSDETIRRFADFNQIFQKYDKNKKRAYNELREKYNDTYWFYALYYYREQ